MLSLRSDKPLIPTIWTSDRPLIFLDFETDGPGEADAATDRIVQAGFLRIDGGERNARSRFVNPGPEFLPLKRTEIHHIKTEDLVDALSFKLIARSLYGKIQGCDIATYNGSNYDVPLLWEEFFRTGIEWNVSQHRFVDVAGLWRKMEPRTLSDAVRRFLGKEPDENMHDAAIDVDCTASILHGMLTEWTKAPHDIVELDKLTASTTKIGGKELPRIDLAGVLVRNERGDAVFSHKTNRGKLLRDDPGYARWILGKDFSENTKMHVRAELKRVDPQQSLL